MNRDPRLAYRRAIFNRDLAIAITPARNPRPIAIAPAPNTSAPRNPTPSINSNGSIHDRQPHIELGNSNNCSPAGNNNTANQLNFTTEIPRRPVSNTEKGMCSAAVKALGGTDTVTTKVNMLLKAALEADQL